MYLDLGFMSSFGALFFSGEIYKIEWVIVFNLKRKCQNQSVINSWNGSVVGSLQLCHCCYLVFWVSSLLHMIWMLNSSYAAVKNCALLNLYLGNTRKESFFFGQPRKEILPEWNSTHWWWTLLKKRVFTAYDLNHEFQISAVKMCG